MGERAWSVSFATESLSLVEMWRAASTCLASLNIVNEDYVSLFYESPLEWFLDSEVPPTAEGVAKLAKDGLGLVISFTKPLHYRIFAMHTSVFFVALATALLKVLCSRTTVGPVV